jgi:hypothetical protein
MFLKSYVEIEASFDVVQAAMLSDPGQRLAGLAAVVEQEGERLLVEVGLEVGGRQLGRRADLVLGEPQVTELVVSLPVRIRVHGDHRMFPSLYGSLDAAWLGATRTQLALSLQYEPPLGALGRAIDRTLLHRVAETVAHDLLRLAAQRLLERTMEHAPSGRREV